MRSLLLLLLLCAAGAAGAQSFRSYAIVNEDATLKIKGRLVRLYGIHIPDTGRTCYGRVAPLTCVPDPAAALNFKIGAHFVGCDPVAEHDDGSVTARCYADGEDLSLWLLGEGLAAALTDAPADYRLAERLAERRGVGMWALPPGLPYGHWPVVPGR